MVQGAFAPASHDGRWSPASIVLALIWRPRPPRSARIGRGFTGVMVSPTTPATFAKVAIYAFSAIAILLGPDRWFRARGDQNFEFPMLILLAALGMGMMASAGDLIRLYIGVELHSLALYVLAAFRRDDAKASEAGLKYFVLGALSSGPAALRRLADLRLRRLDPSSTDIAAAAAGQAPARACCSAWCS